MCFNFFLTNIFNFVKIKRKGIKKSKNQLYKKEMQGRSKSFNHLCYNNIIIFRICQQKRKQQNRKNCDKWKIQNKIENFK